MHDAQLVDRPEQPLQLRFRHERRHAECPDFLGVEAKASGKLGPRQPLGWCRTGRRRDRVDLHRRHAALLKKAAGLAKGSGVPNKDTVGKVTKVRPWAGRHSL